jgi:4-amino-4-deoxychorismate lyase
MRFALVDGAPAYAIAIDDRALHYGDGLPETIAVACRRARVRFDHLERLARGAATLRLPPPDLALMAREIASAATTPRGRRARSS